MNAEAYGYQSASTMVTVDAGDTVTQDFTLNRLPSGILYGRVIAGDSIGVSGATVEFVNAPLPTMITDSDGLFIRSVPGDSDYNLRVKFHDVLSINSITVPLNDTAFVDIFLDSPRSLTQGPDVYGYFAYDNLDDVLAPSFDWIEISPERGGEGIGGLPPGNDQSMQFVMPFPFWFYGEPCDTLIVNENGWITTASSSLGFFQNGSIPGSAGPSGMLAPFWDNLFHVDDADVSWWYDELHHRVIIEYYKMRVSSQSEHVVTFQVQIFDREFQPTATGDCEVLYLYEEIGPSFLPTIGIENPLETIGLQLQYNTDYGTNTWQIVSGSAILISTSYIGSVTGTITGHPEPDDYTLVTIESGGSETSAFASGFYSLANIRTGMQEVVVTLDGYETLHEMIEILPQQSSTLDIDIWRLDPPQNLDAILTEDHAVLLEWDEPVSVGGTLDQLERYSVYENGQLLGTTEETEYLTPILTETGVYEYFVTAIYDGGGSIESNHDSVDFTSESLIGEDLLPHDYSLDSPFPNPFNSSTSITFALPRVSRVAISIYDVLGREVVTLANTEYPAGYHRLHWNAEGVSSGLYFVTMRAHEFVKTQKVLLIQ